MGRPICVVFSDAFAYRSYVKIGGLGDGFSLKKIKPGIGYSSNLHYLLFDGKAPDEVGFFTDYAWKSSKKDTKVGAFFKKCDEIETLNNLWRVIRRKTVKRVDNIPYTEQDYFAQKGKYKFMQSGECSVFGENVTKVYEKDTNQGFEKAFEYVKVGAKGIVVVLEELDHVGHDAGSLGKSYMSGARNIIEKSRKLFNLFTKYNPEGLCVLISDHGMSDVMCNVDVLAGIKRKFGLPGKGYQIYNDSIYLRVWSDNKSTLSEFHTYLNGISVLAEVSPEERKKYGVLSRAAGDLIYRLREGYSFEPNCFGVSIRGGSAGLHGYMEPSDAASGILVVNDAIGEDKMVEAIKVYDIVKGLIM